MAGNAKKTEMLRDRDKSKEEIRDIFSQRLNDLLVQNSELFIMTGAELAEKANISAGIISEYRNGKNAPSIDKLARISKALGKSADYLMGLTSDLEGRADVMAVEKELGLSAFAYDRLHALNSGWLGGCANIVISSTGFLKAVNQIYSLLELDLPPGYHAIVPKADFDAIINDGIGKARLVPRYDIERIYINAAKDALLEMVDEIVKNIKNKKEGEPNAT